MKTTLMKTIEREGPEPAAGVAATRTECNNIEVAETFLILILYQDLSTDSSLILLNSPLICIYLSSKTWLLSGSTAVIHDLHGEHGAVAGQARGAAHDARGGRRGLRGCEEDFRNS